MAALHVLVTSRRGTTSATWITRLALAKSVANVTICKIPIKRLRPPSCSPGYRPHSALSIRAKQRFAKAPLAQHAVLDGDRNRHPVRTDFDHRQMGPGH